ncbi:MAG: RNA polymerase subunit sigma-24 [Clostridiales bacterium GWF2_38_85]|nr:MAG: RNA polymerase subunit sigma-24 [Clostridiales bacterium GWF2_38_85]
MDNQSLRTTDSVDEIIKNYSSMVFRIAYSRTKNKYDADDVMQNVFMRYIRKERHFESEEHRKAWFIRTTINCSNSFFTTSWFKNTTSFSDAAGSQIAPSDDNSSVVSAVSELPKNMRSMIYLFYYEEYSVKKIAEILGKSESAVKTQLFRARGLLKKKFEEEDL